MNQNNSTEQTDFPLTESKKQTDFSYLTFLKKLKDPNTIYRYYLKKRLKRLIEKEKAARFFNNSFLFYDLINWRKQKWTTAKS